MTPAAVRLIAAGETLSAIRKPHAKFEV